MSDLEKPRLSRLTEIIMQLQSKRLVTAPYLAEKYDVSIRTIYRDMRTLERSGIPVVTEEGRGYALMEGYHMPPVMFTENEANALVTAEQLIRRNKDQSLVEHYSNAVAKVKAILRNSQKEETDLLSKRIVFSTNYMEQRTSNLLMTVQSTISKRNLLEIEYQSLKDKTSIRMIEPFAVYSTQENWLLIAFCRLRTEFRVFRLDRISKLIVQTDLFEPHDMTLESYFESQQNNSSNP